MRGRLYVKGEQAADIAKLKPFSPQPLTAAPYMLQVLITEIPYCSMTLHQACKRVTGACNRYTCKRARKYGNR